MPAVGLSTVLILLTACSPEPLPDSSPTPAVIDDALPADPGFGHIHAVDLNPGDHLVYVAAHNSVFRINDDGPERVGESQHDAMGLVILGPDVFLSSGHPFGGAGPSNMGLLRSADAATSWEAIALEGEVDFHALSSAGERIVGWDSTGADVMRSDDGGLTWQAGARLRLADMDVDPLDPDHVVATTPEGLMVNYDAGATFEAHPVQPPQSLILVDHIGEGDDPAQMLAGLSEDGTLWTLDGQEWVAAGSPVATPEAFTAVNSQTYLAAFQGDVYRSDNGGATWTLISA